ncbi:WD40 repeat and WD40/YVTN repeat-like-containing domain and WD40-repeat-containing domain-containing protein [Strongyloides ratti]|uniref:WD40 repeat and WD40/YVTN repeat-like-containing domain and WD40-repeat-containing domain-containing protein n=1 Tax=Strongyloides ratti TaxID=34506 RepID=A0A090L9T0_STRRB|nr:WD40 repeat and WD40/YVTN repeat-like-containing domain and WD40-repeat-containing domain-containing protein [Strongyloides ratti]CEF66507.1 WD40 repeat and WD40/YVTN repeat-like-containing domain and WD40-repeat-containing domain-containing protein [Strongyloides ratti]
MSDFSNNNQNRSPDVYVGALTGAVKALSFKEDTFINLNEISELKPKEDEVVKMAFSDIDKKDFLFVTRGKKFNYYNSLCNSVSTIFEKKDTLKGNVCGVAVNGDLDILTVTSNGDILLLNNSGDNKLDEWNIGPGLQGFATDHYNDISVFATGGKENELKVWDLSTKQKKFEARNVKHDNLNLRVPVNILNISFAGSEDKIVTSTKNHRIRMYDSKAQQKPVVDISWLENPITAMSIGYEKHYVVVGNAIGEMGLFDLRTQRLVHKYKGASGSIRSIVAHPYLPYVVSAGLDRFVRLHDMKKHVLIKRYYGKVRLSALLVQDTLSFINVKKEEV